MYIASTESEDGVLVYTLTEGPMQKGINSNEGKKKTVILGCHRPS